MKTNRHTISAVPTNIITGFLGVGKTSAIIELLKQKPKEQRWGILVNEFGEIGIDGEIFSGLRSDPNIYIEQVPGGCMCCASNLPMQIALNQLLIKSEPHRLLIEPTGLGHPKEVLQLLSTKYYIDVLNIEKTITLVDARTIAEPAYTDHPTFNQQLAIADVIVGNKTDLYSAADQEALINYLNSKNYTPRQLYFTKHGQIPLSWLSGDTDFCNHQIPDQQNLHEHTHHHEHEDRHHPERDNTHLDDNLDRPFTKAINEGEGYMSIGWTFKPHLTFNRHKLKTFLSSVVAVRIKGVFITDQGYYGYNHAFDHSTNTINEIQLNRCEQSRIEIICNEINQNWEETLLSTIES